MAGAVYPDLNGKTVVVTGGASGIGEAITRAFVGQGAKVGFLDLDATAGTALAADLGASVQFERVDLRDIDALRAAIGRIRAALGPIGVLVNNAARDDRHKLDDVTPDYWRDRMATNLDHQFFAAQAVIPDMRALGGGSIINIGSTSYLVSGEAFVAYKTAKSASLGLTRALACEVGPDNIRVNLILPGWIMTRRQIDLWLTPEGEANMLKSQCLKRRLVPDDIARPVLFYASEEAAAITNQSHIIDGGWY